jgi:hypothetical protein
MAVECVKLYAGRHMVGIEARTALDKIEEIDK